MPTEERVAKFGWEQVIERLDLLPLNDFQQYFEGRFVDESYSLFPHELILTHTDAERSARGGHADRFWAIALACQKERGPGPSKGVEIGVRVLG